MEIKREIQNIYNLVMEELQNPSNEKISNYIVDKFKKIKNVIENERKNTKPSKKIFFNAKNYEFSYPKNINTHEILQNLKLKFPMSGIELTIDSNFQIFFVKSRKEKQISSMHHYKINKISPIIRTFSYDQLSKLKKIKNPDSDVIKPLLKSFLENPNENDCFALASEFKDCISGTKILIHSEYIIASIVFNYLRELGVETSWEYLKLFSLDAKMEVYQMKLDGNEVSCPFRCDLVLFFRDNLFIFEYKYRYDRKNSQVDTAMKCIETKDYVWRVIEFLNKNYKEIIKETTSVTSVGIGYSIKNDEVNCEMKFNKENLNKYLIKESMKSNIIENVDSSIPISIPYYIFKI